MKRVKIKSNGLELAALVDEALSENSPLIILLHGFTGWKEEKHIESLAAELSAAGITTLRFDAPGSGASGGSWEKDYRVTNYINAVSNVCEWAIANLDIDKSRIGLWGHSMGGLVAVQAAARWPEVFKALCGCQPSTKQGSSFRSQIENGGKEFNTEIFGTIWLPEEFYHDRLRYDTVETVKELTMPKLIIAGTNDTLVTSEAVKEIYVAATEPKTLLEFETDHFYKNDPAILEHINDATVSFFRENLL